MAYDRKQGGHEVAQANQPDYRLEVGRAEVPVGEPRDFSVLDPARAATLLAWTATLIPAGRGRPDAGSIGAAEYIDATVLQVPALRPALMHALDSLERMAQTKANSSFSECDPDERERLLRDFQVEDDTDAFNMVSDFTYEAYYGHPQVLAALEKATGWRGMNPMTGSQMAPFDEKQLTRVRSLPPRWRSVPPEKKARA
ncbi:MAG TPA: gluconate 2-dehydrogenase subunit 3 family protein [Candidatus Dormibacteraeota bacterium]|nr:gluconate 2-dehydrogenase subunit 3 family protein [Candidatus Dormibacteraeota bacterium]